MSLSLLIASIGITIITVALNLFIHSKKILEKKAKLRRIGERMINWWLFLFAIGTILIIYGSVISVVRNTYIAVGVSVIATSMNVYVVEIMFRKPNSGGKRFGKKIWILSQILGYLALIAIFASLILSSCEANNGGV